MNKVLKIFQLGDPVLRQRCRPVVKVNDKQTRHLIDSMVPLLATADGLGLAAPQVGQNRRLCVMVANPDRFQEGKEKPRIEAVINPHLVSRSPKKTKGWEGCLSVPGLVGLVERADWIKVEYFNRQGKKVKRKLSAFPARVFQHEYDHLEGRLFIDRVAVLKNQLKKS